MTHAPLRRSLTRTLLATGLLMAAPGTAQAVDEAIATGRTLFTSEATPPCAVCHTLADAGSSGEIGPNLDELKPTADQVRTAVTGGVGIMPAYETLTDEQIEALAHYVSSVAGAP